jgi:hypothetical protein
MYNKLFVTELKFVESRIKIGLKLSNDALLLLILCKEHIKHKRGEQNKNVITFWIFLSRPLFELSCTMSIVQDVVFDIHNMSCLACI